MWNNVRIRTRLFIGFGILLVLFIITGWFSLRAVRTVANLSMKLYEHPLVVSNAARDAHIYILKMQQGLSDAVLSRDDSRLSAAIEAVNEYEQSAFGKLNILEERFLGDKQKVHAFSDRLTGWRSLREAALKLVKEGKKEEAAADIIGKNDRYVAGLEMESNYFIDFAGEKAGEFINDARAIEQKAYTFVLLITILAVVIAFPIAYTLTISITRPLAQAVNVSNHLALNDISIDIEKSEAKDEPGMLLRSMKTMLDHLRKQTADIMEGVNVVAGSAGEISATTTQFAAGFAEIASSTNETVTSMKEVQQTSELTSEKARNVSESARNVLQVSRGGEKALNETIAAMNGIQEQMAFIAESIVGLSEQTQSIGEIIAVVDDIAEQSRLLAVNASIEAVKAGEQGKGFSVVAAEIKNLAQQSKQSTGQVRSILAEIQKATGNSVMVTEKGAKTVDNGVKQAQQTGEAFQALGQSILETSQAAMQIEATARQQLAGIDHVFTAMESINVAITQNAQAAKQLESAARGLEELGKKLKVIVQVYKL
ncbi:MAG: methyl-accepting chemotaxis protein [Candidatus Aminicenantes bacterium]|nr:methyl-accepting chemotaxis protein [Candidatus Aminicenantes bacterium]